MPRGNEGNPGRQMEEQRVLNENDFDRHQYREENAHSFGNTTIEKAGFKDRVLDIIKRYAAYILILIAVFTWLALS